jgi:hypothetical protein
VLDMHPFDYFTVSHSPPGFPTAIWMTYDFQPTDDNNTHFTLTFIGRIPYLPDWLKKQFCLYILRTQIFKMWKLESINDLIKNNSAIE